jgi:hypothetical protein
MNWAAYCKIRYTILRIEVKEKYKAKKKNCHVSTPSRLKFVMVGVKVDSAEFSFLACKFGHPFSFSLFAHVSPI